MKMESQLEFLNRIERYLEEIYDLTNDFKTPTQNDILNSYYQGLLTGTIKERIKLLETKDE